MKKMKKLLAVMLALACVLTAFPTMEAKAATVTVTGGHTTRADAYTWSTYSEYNSIIVELPERENDFWLKFTLPKNSRYYASCTYNSENADMYIEMKNASNLTLDKKIAPEDVIDDRFPFMAVACDNLTSSTQTFYIHANRGNSSGMIRFSLDIKNRIKTGNATFSFSGTASNPGNSSVSLSGVDSSVLSLDLTNNSTIPPEAIVTSARTSSTQSPNQGNVHHMIRPATETSTWYTAKSSGATRGSYTIDVTDNFSAGQRWEFKYNALATARSTMKNVTLTLHWEYDLKNTGYKAY